MHVKMSPFKVTTGDGKSEDDEKYKTLQQKKGNSSCCHTRSQAKSVAAMNVELIKISGT